MSSNKTVVVNLGVANYGSMMNMLNRVGADALLTDNAEQLKSAARIILPGVGSFDAVMSALNNRPDLREVIEQRVLSEHIPFMGVCVGMQLLFSGSEEGNLPGLNWITGSIKKFSFPAELRLPVPHMGWNVVHALKRTALLSMDEKYKFYFAHSYRAIDVDEAQILASSDYGDTFISAVVKENIFGFQFHPEKSHKFGMRLFQKFIEI